MSLVSPKIRQRVEPTAFPLPLEKHFGADVIFFYGEIHPFLTRPFRDFIERLRKKDF